MIFDWDDFGHDDGRFLARMRELKELRPDFKATLFAVPMWGDDWTWHEVPDWLELAMHGWAHPDPMECAFWSAQRMHEAITLKPARFVTGFKAPGWQISDGCYEALADAGWWVADQHYNDERRPPKIPVHLLGDGQHWHGHVQNCSGNGIEETWEKVVFHVSNASSFQFVSEAVS